MGILQGLVGIGMALGGGSLLAYAVVQMANNSITGEFGVGLATSGVIGIILGIILLYTND